MWTDSPDIAAAVQRVTPAELAQHYAGLMLPRIDDPRAKAMIQKHLDFSLTWKDGEPVPMIYRAVAFHNEVTDQSLFLRRPAETAKELASVNGACEADTAQFRESGSPSMKT